MRKIMQRRIKYTDEPLEKLKTVKDFLPPPGQLDLKEDKRKVNNDKNSSTANEQRNGGG
jgi:hypothetical protein